MGAGEESGEKNFDASASKLQRLREQGSVVNAQKMISITFNGENQIIRVSISGDV